LPIAYGVDAQTDGGISFGSVHSAPDPTTGVQYDRAAQTTTLNLISATGLGTVDIYKGTITSPGIGNGTVAGVPPPPGWQFKATSCFLNNLAVAVNNATSGPLASGAGGVDQNPAVGTATFYVSNAAAGGVLNGALGCVNPGRCFKGLTPDAACAVDNNCLLFCSGGASPLASCTTNANCAGKCSTSPFASCTSNAQCGAGTCTSPAPGTCTSTGVCVGGPTPGTPCLAAAGCGAGGACSFGFCLNVGQAGPLQNNQLIPGYGCPTAVASPYMVNSSAAPPPATACQP